MEVLIVTYIAAIFKAAYTGVAGNQVYALCQ